LIYCQGIIIYIYFSSDSDYFHDSAPLHLTPLFLTPFFILCLMANAPYLTVVETPSSARSCG